MCSFKCSSTLGEVNTVGASFGVYKILDCDVSIPRRDSKTDRGHKGFVVTGDPFMSVEDAARVGTSPSTRFPMTR
jgi:hypothetical protein